MKNVFVEASFRVVATKKGHQLVAAQPLLVEMPLKDFPTDVEDSATRNLIFFTLVDSEVRAQAVKLFISQLKSDSELKRFIGGTQWSVEPAGSIEEFPIFFLRDQVGLIDKLINTRDPYKLTEQIIERNHTLVNQIKNKLSEPAASL